MAAAMLATRNLSSKIAELFRYHILTANVSAGRKIFRGDVVDKGFQLEKLTSEDIPAVNINAAASPKPLPAARMIPVIILGDAAGSSQSPAILWCPVHSCLPGSPGEPPGWHPLSLW